MINISNDCVLIAFLFIIIFTCYMQNNNNIKNTFSNTFENTVENIVENDMRRKTTYVNLTYGRPNKCFSCEKDILKNYGSEYINYAFPSKCFSCEKQSRNPYMEGPTKCFTCDKNKII